MSTDSMAKDRPRRHCGARRPSPIPPRGGWPCLLLGIALAGCVTTHPRRYDELAAEPGRSPSPRGRDEQRASLDTLARLDRTTFVLAVLEENPSVETARQAWRAALAQVPQATSLPDPMLEYSFAPLSIGSDKVPYGQVVAVSQGFPWPGKLALAGEVALAEAEDARESYQAVRQDLALVAATFFDQYVAVTGSIELNEEHQKLALDIKATAEAQYAAGRAGQDEPLQAEIEVSYAVRQRVELESRRAVLVAQMNGLLHRAADRPLPPPAPHEPALAEVAPSEALKEQATRDRAELRASQARIRGREAAVDLARRQYYPDFEVMASYDSMWMDREHQWMIGLSLNLPIRRATRRGAVDEAEARLSGARSQLSSAEDQVGVEVEQARQRLIEARGVVTVYRDRLLPAAHQAIAAARIGYATGQGSFQALITAERSLRTLELEHLDAVAVLGQRRAELDRAIGRIPGLIDEGVTP